MFKFIKIDDETLVFLKKTQKKFEEKANNYKTDGKNPVRDKKVKLKYSIISKDLKRIIDLIVK